MNDFSHVLNLPPSVVVHNWGKTQETLEEFVLDASVGEKKRFPWGSTDIKCPMSSFDRAFQYLFSERMRQARAVAQVRVVVKEISDDDMEDSLTLVGPDFRQRMVFRTAEEYLRGFSQLV